MFQPFVKSESDQVASSPCIVYLGSTVTWLNHIYVCITSPECLSFSHQSYVRVRGDNYVSYLHRNLHLVKLPQSAWATEA